MILVKFVIGLNLIKIIPTDLSETKYPDGKQDQ